jgi:transcriptional regulator with XRE-family HTH domain
MQFAKLRTMRPQSPRHLLLGRSIRGQRKQRGISQEKLAELADVHRTYLGGVERGERNPSFSSLLRVADALNVPLAELVAPVDAR